MLLYRAKKDGKTVLAELLKHPQQSEAKIEMSDRVMCVNLETWMSRRMI